MQLGFVSAIVPELSLEEVFSLAADEGCACVELMCWPAGGADRRYAGVTHLDVSRLDADALGRVHALVEKSGVAISGLGYYPNPLTADVEQRRVAVDQIGAVIDAAKALGLGIVNTFIGRDHTKSLEAQWPTFDAVWPGLVRRAEAANVKIAIEHCPMLFSDDEWPGGKNLAVSPAVWLSKTISGACSAMIASRSWAFQASL